VTIFLYARIAAIPFGMTENPLLSEPPAYCKSRRQMNII